MFCKEFFSPLYTSNRLLVHTSAGTSKAPLIVIQRICLGLMPITEFIWQINDSAILQVRLGECNSGYREFVQMERLIGFEQSFQCVTQGQNRKRKIEFSTARAKHCTY